MGMLALLGLISLVFSAGAYYATSSFGVIGWANAVAGIALLGAAGVAWLRRAPGLGSPIARRVLLPRIVWVGIAIAASVGVERLTALADLRADLTADARYTIAPATRTAIDALPGPVVATLYVDAEDNRARNTRLLLQTLAAGDDRIEVRERTLDQVPQDVDRYGISSSNTVVLSIGDRWQLVTRPTAGSLYEGLRRLADDTGVIVYVARGEGEGDIQRTDEAGFSGLAAALVTEGFTVRDFVTASVTAIPDDASLLLFIGPQRPMREPSLAALETWLAQGGRLVALLEPGTETDLEPLLARWGFGLPDAIVVDPASGPVEGDPPGVNPIAFQFASHPITRGLDATHMVFFRKARPVLAAHKPQPDDEVRDLVFASRRAWLAPNAAAVQRGAVPERPAEVEEDYWPLLAVGRYPREFDGRDVETRIAVFGDTDFANNHALRALYNLDLLMNTIQWAVERPGAITLRPKTLTPDQYPLTPQQSLDMLYGVGLSIPQLCVAAAAYTWWRRRSG